MKKKPKKPIRLECHGGPMDGDWLSMEEGQHDVIVRMGPDMVSDRVMTGQLELDPARPESRTGRYRVQGYKPWGSERYQQVLRWEGEL